MFKFTIERMALSASYSIVYVVAHPDPATAQERAVSHAKRLERLDRPLSTPSIYRVTDASGKVIYESRR